jgi:hypothetical protein
VFASLPQRGELRLELALATELIGRDLGADLAFEGPDGGVRYSDAVAIDAAGRRCALALDLRGDRVELVVPAAFVAHAELPLVVDPLASTVLLANTGNFSGFADVAFDYTTQEFLVVWQSAFSATDMDLWAWRLDLQQNPVGSPFALDFTGVSWAYPRVANNGQFDTFLVVAECSSALAFPRWIGGRVWSLAGGSLPPFVVEQQGFGGSLGGSCSRPDVGGDAAEAGSTWFTVVWEREFSAADHDIVMRQVDPTGVLRTWSPTAVDVGSGYESAPRIAKSNGYALVSGLSGQYWPIVYQRTFSTSDEDVRGSIVDANGAFVGTATFPIATSSRDERNPVVSSPTDTIGGQRRHAVAYVRTELATSTDILVSVRDASGGLLTTGNLQVLEGAGAAAAWAQVSPAIDSDGYRFTVAYGEQWSGTGGDFDTRASTLAYDETSNVLVAHESRAAVATSGDYESFPALASTYSGGGSTVIYGLALHSVGATSSSVHATVYRGHAPGPLPTLRATACHGLSIGLTDIPALGRVVSFTQGDSGPLTGFVIGTPVALPLPFCPGCTVGVDGPLTANPFALFFPLSTALVGLNLACQAWSLQSGTCLGSIALSDTIDFTIL